VVFDNSLADGSWYYSHSHVVPPSELDQADGKIPGRRSLPDAAKRTAGEMALRLAAIGAISHDDSVENPRLFCGYGDNARAAPPA
jgi:hypothetical protein